MAEIIPNQANEDLRARYRYLDLRRSAMSDNLRKRSQVARIVRSVLYEQGAVFDWGVHSDILSSCQTFLKSKHPCFSNRLPRARENSLFPLELQGIWKARSLKNPNSTPYHRLPSNPNNYRCVQAELTSTSSWLGVSATKMVERIVNLSSHR